MVVVVVSSSKVIVLLYGWAVDLVGWTCLFEICLSRVL